MVFSPYLCSEVLRFIFFASFRKALFLCPLPGASLFVRPEFSGPPFRSSRVLPVFSFNPIGRFHFPENSVDRGFQAVAPR